MQEIKVNFSNLSEKEREQLLKIVEKANAKQVELSRVEIGKTFKIGDTEFIKFTDAYGVTTAITKDIICKSTFGDNNDLRNSNVLKILENEFLPKIVDEIGIENICDIQTDLTTLDGLKPYGIMTSKISLPTLDFYRANVDIFDKYKIDGWWWLATPESANPHDNPNWVTCVSPSGYVGINGYYDDNGVRPFLRFVSSILVSCEE